MKIDPNQPVEFRQECVLCEDGQVVLFDDSRTPEAELDREESAFQKFCRSLDPNKCFISAFIPNDSDKGVFFKAREVALSVGLHMQATVDTPERHRTLWDRYQTMKRLPSEERS